MTTNTLRGFRDAGFDTHVVALAVPDWQSRLSTLERYVTDHMYGNAARWTALEAHDVAYANAPTTVTQAIEAGAVTRATVLDRDGKQLHDSHQPKAIAVTTALEQERSRLPKPGEAENHSRRFEQAAAYLEQIGELNDRTAPTVLAIQRDRDLLRALERRALAGAGSPQVIAPPPERGAERPPLRLVDPPKNDLER